MCLGSFYVHYNPHLNTVQPTAFEVLIFHENTEMITPDESSDISPGNNDPTEGIKIVLVEIIFRNKISWLKVVREEKS